MSESIDEALQAAVDSGAAPNVVGMAAEEEGVIYEGAAGPRAAGGGQPVGADSIFRIASMTKTVCAVAALQQRERGNLDFDAPVDTAPTSPLYGCWTVSTTADRECAPASRATVKQLVTHTAGMPNSFWNGDIVRWEAVGGPDSAPGGLKDAFASPMVADPGTRYEGGGWVATDIDCGQHPDWWSGRHGLYSTSRDYLRFHQMLLCGGTFEGTTILDRSSVHDAFANQIGDLWVPAEMPTTNTPWSRDFRSVRRRSGAGACCSTPANSQACAPPEAVPGPGSSTLTSGWTPTP